MFAAGAARRDTLLDLLADARRTALTPLGRVTFDLDGVIEREKAAHPVSDLPEPASLHEARRKVQERTARQRTLEQRANAVAEQLSDQLSRPMLQRLFGAPVAPYRQTLEACLDQLQRKFLKATADLATARHELRTEERKFQIERVRHQSALSARKEAAGARITAATAAQRLLEKNPRLAFWGAAQLMRMTMNIQKARSEWVNSDANLAPDWELVPILDLWGKPYLPRLRV